MSKEDIVPVFLVTLSYVEVIVFHPFVWIFADSE